MCAGTLRCGSGQWSCALRDDRRGVALARVALRGCCARGPVDGAALQVLIVTHVRPQGLVDWRARASGPTQVSRALTHVSWLFWESAWSACRGLMYVSKLAFHRCWRCHWRCECGPAGSERECLYASHGVLSAQKNVSWLEDTSVSRVTRCLGLCLWTALQRKKLRI